jgi:hypothetical protein
MIKPKLKLFNYYYNNSHSFILFHFSAFYAAGSYPYAKHIILKYSPSKIINDGKLNLENAV